MLARAYSLCRSMWTNYLPWREKTRAGMTARIANVSAGGQFGIARTLKQAQPRAEAGMHDGAALLIARVHEVVPRRMRALRGGDAAHDTAMMHLLCRALLLA